MEPGRPDHDGGAGALTLATTGDFSHLGFVARPGAVWPLRVMAGAFGPGRDLLLSPDHAVFVDGMLMPVGRLVNGATVRQERTEEVTYCHVELPAHDVVLAEGLECESYLDTGNRGAFANGGAVVERDPDFARLVWAAEACAPQVTGGPRLAAVAARLLARAEARRDGLRVPGWQ